MTQQGGGPPEPIDSRKLSSSEIEQYTTQAKRGFFWIFSTTALWQFISWICTLLTIRVLHPEDYGLVALPDAIFPYLMMLATLRLDTWLVQTEHWTEHKQQAAQTLLIALALVSSALGLVAAPLLSTFYNAPDLLPVAQAMCLTFVPRALRVLPESRLRRELKFKPVAVGNLVVGIARGVLQVALAYLGFRYWTLIWGAIFNELALLIWMWASAGTTLRLRWDTAVFKDALSFGLSATASTVFWVIFSTADNLVVGKLFGTEMLGFYATAFMLTELPLSKLNTVLAPIMTPYYSKLRHNREELFRVFLRVNQTLVAIVAPALVGLAIVAPTMVAPVFGDQWAPMTTPLKVMCVVGVLRGLTANVSSLLFALNEPHKVLKVSGIMTLVLPASFYLLGKELEMNEIYLTWLLVYPILGPILFFSAVVEVSGIPLRKFVMNVYPPVIAVLVMAAVTFGVTAVLPAALSPWLMLGVQIVVGACSYLSAYRVFFPAAFQEGRQLLFSVRLRKA